MRLLHSTTLEFTEFFDPPPYAILSHTWGEDEVTHQEMKSLTPHTRLKAGFHKIQRAAGLAKLKGYDYIWVDTVCIDKTSSADLSEAINSMYKWYQQSAVCFAFLSDVSLGPVPEMIPILPDSQHKKFCDLFPSCRWITRGWTLQELVAPKNLLFYGSDFNYIGTKVSLIWILSMATGIGVEVLNSCDPSSVDIAEKMSWAATRKTTRVEDIAYSLLGIFNINMPLLYGEGDRAFLRLQEEILKSSDDHSLFAWRANVDSRFSYRGLLAQSPDEFSYHKHLFPESSYRIFDDYPTSYQLYDDHPTWITNKGVQITLPLCPLPKVRIVRQRIVCHLMNTRL
jgi:hypothetical protein